MRAAAQCQTKIKKKKKKKKKKNIYIYTYIGNNNKISILKPVSRYKSQVYRIGNVYPISKPFQKKKKKELKK